MAPRRTSAALGMKRSQLSRGSRILLGLDRHAARYTWTVVFVLLLVGLLYLIRETLFIFVVALLFAYLLWPLVKLLDRRLPGRSKVLALTLVYLAMVGILIVMGIALGSRVIQQANTLAARLPELLAKFQPPIAPAVSHLCSAAEDHCHFDGAKATGQSFGRYPGIAFECRLGGHVARRKPHLFHPGSDSQFLLPERWPGNAQFCGGHSCRRGPPRHGGENCR